MNRNMMNLKIVLLIGVASVLSSICFAQPAEEASPKAGKKNEPRTYQEKFMKRAIEISRTALTKPGTEPFGAVIVWNGEDRRRRPQPCSRHAGCDFPRGD